ncbi:Histone deacetylase-like amidohydrolase [Aquisphaera giovannonii]|uniref:histone deacetylase n=1 Tax=Aquisphaera giovannonii TaxID=406548 RepID=A0A5B9VYT5_9BACT|nr:histone deacetylase [Aquisphaera giovannonii]QEH32790.1 Histone deacetylase-like amidohydrolase [Aquisphaera giovannonii]
MSVTLFTDRRMIDHRVPPHHPERPERLQAILRHLERTGFTETCPSGTVREATRDELLRVHGTAYLREVEQLEARGGGSLDPDTWLYPGSALAARLAAGAAIEAVRDAMKGKDRRAVCLVRPPGHHALPDDAMGFCIFSNVALAAMEAITALDLRRVLIVDFDVHHGNGTQDVFYASERVGFLSIHRYPFYPGTGSRAETGTGPGLGHTVNVPIAHGTPTREYHAAFRAALDKLADEIRPDLVLVSAGFDAHAEDPVGDLGLDFEDFAKITEDLVRVAETHSQGRIVSVLEGGYNVPILAGCVEAHLKALGAEPGHPGA